MHNEGTLKVDGVEIIPVRSSGSTSTIEFVRPFYLGGFPVDVAKGAAENTEVRITIQTFSVALCNL